MDINDLTIGQAKELASLFGGKQTDAKGLNQYAIGEKVIVRTYSAGVWFGVLSEKSANEVILKKARRLWRWWAAESISLSAVAVFGIKQDKSQIAPELEQIWLEAIEIIPTTDVAAKSIESEKNAKAE